MSKIEKITIFGGPGTGKTRLADILSDMFNLPVYHLDAFQFESDWKPRPKDVRDAKILETVKKDSWIIEGVYTSTLEARIKAADLIIFLDFKTIDLVKGVVQRFLKAKMSGEKEKSEIPGCKENIDFEFIKYIFSFNKNKREKIYQIMNNNPDKKVVILNNRDSVDKYVSLLKMEEIESL